MRKMNPTEQKILTVAKQMFVSKGYENVKLSDIAEHAGFANAVLTYYFFNKDFLCKSIFDDVMSEFTQKTTDKLTPDLSLNEAIKKIIDIHFDIFLENSQVLIFVLSYLHRSKKEITELNPLIGIYNFDFYTKLLSIKFYKGTINEFDPTDFVINLLSLISYPFTMQRFITAKHNFDDVSFKRFMVQRKKKILDLMMLSVANENKNNDFSHYIDSAVNILSNEDNKRFIS